MQHDEYITHGQMEHYLKTHTPVSTGKMYSQARHYFHQSGLLRHTPPRIASGCDIILVSDEEFIDMCDELPISPFFLDDTTQLSSHSLFPPNYECYVIQHLNSLHVDMHHHDFFEICYVWQGSCIQSTGKHIFEMEAGDFLIIPPGIDHTVKIQTDDTILFNIMARREAFLSSSFPLLSQSFAISAFLRHSLLQSGHENCLLIHTENPSVLKRIVKHLVQECYTLQELFCDFAINIFNQLFCFILLFGEVKAKYLCLPDNFSPIAILHEIQQNYKTVTLSSLSEKFFFSEEHMSRLIKKTTGKTFSALLRETRINQAKTLVARTDLTIEQVSELVGYNDSSAFTKAFKSYVGLSPTKYRKHIAGE